MHRPDWNRNRDTGKSTADIFVEHGIQQRRRAMPESKVALTLREYQALYRQKMSKQGDEYTTAKGC